MNISAVYAENGNKSNIKEVAKMIFGILRELGDIVQVLNVEGLSYYNGTNADLAKDIMSKIATSDAVIFASPVYMGNISAEMQCFLEYFQDLEYNNILNTKNCLLLAVASEFGEREAMTNLAKTINFLGGYDVVNIVLNQKLAYIGSSEVEHLLEKQTEDFYRIIRQKRQYIVSKQILKAENISKNNINGQKNIDLEDFNKKHSLKNLTGSQQLDVERISKMFAKKIVKTDNILSADIPADTSSSIAAVRPKTCKQYSQSLPHYFNFQLAADIKANIQLSITGSEGFEGYISVNNTQCEFYDGTASENDIIIIADSKVWLDILKKNITAQKAFMMGQVKVRGNFVLLSKFDQLFNKIP